MDPYQPDAWHDFFVATAGAAAALTGLLFVSLSLHIRYIATDTLYRNMARGSLIGLVQTLVLSLAVLVRQPDAWLGIELVLVGLFYLAVMGGYQVAAVRRVRWRVPAVTLVRSSIGYLLAIAGIVGGVDEGLHIGPGLYVVALIAIVIVIWNLRNAWILLMGVADEEITRQP